MKWASYQYLLRDFNFLSRYVTVTNNFEPFSLKWHGRRGENLSNYLPSFDLTKTKALFSDNLHFLDKSLNPPRTWRDAVINFDHQYHFLQSNFPIISLNSTEWLARNFIFADIWFLFSFARYIFTFCSPHQLECMLTCDLSSFNRYRYCSKWSYDTTAEIR